MADIPLGRRPESEKMAANTTIEGQGVPFVDQIRENEERFFSQNKHLLEATTKKRSAFQITSVTTRGAVALEHLRDDPDADSMDDLDDTHTEDISSEILDWSKTTDMELDPSSEDTLQLGSKPSTAVADPQSRFRVVKIESKEPFKRGRWVCFDFFDPPSDKSSESRGGMDTDREVGGSGNSSASSSIHFVHGVDDPSKNPLLTNLPAFTDCEHVIIVPALDVNNLADGGAGVGYQNGPNHQSNSVADYISQSKTLTNVSDFIPITTPDYTQQNCELYTNAHGASVRPSDVVFTTQTSLQDYALNSGDSNSVLGASQSAQPSGGETVYNKPTTVTVSTSDAGHLSGTSVNVSNSNSVEYVSASSSVADIAKKTSVTKQDISAAQQQQHNANAGSPSPAVAVPVNSNTGLASQIPGDSESSKASMTKNNNPQQNLQVPQQQEQSKTGGGGQTSAKMANNPPQGGVGFEQMLPSTPDQLKELLEYVHSNPGTSALASLRDKIASLNESSEQSQQTTVNVNNLNVDMSAFTTGASGGAAGGSSEKQSVLSMEALMGATGGSLSSAHLLESMVGIPEALGSPKKDSDTKDDKEESASGNLWRRLSRQYWGGEWDESGINNAERRGSSTVAIDNKIEQAMDLVKSHLMFAVREEVEVLKEQIKELLEQNAQLEYENNILKTNASSDTLTQLKTPRPAQQQQQAQQSQSQQQPPSAT
ncbi:uncharacterized protein LOC141911361 isoform X2 [Tubulanus polymorphus]|uniref:uncharacterized protein LOC141911361 isoform X2 n=1 Tax=Tubulanus polymorphus TaxID=672921 RepID=UPI003DA21A46